MTLFEVSAPSNNAFLFKINESISSMCHFDQTNTLTQLTRMKGFFVCIRRLSGLTSQATVCKRL